MTHIEAMKQALADLKYGLTYDSRTMIYYAVSQFEEVIAEAQKQAALAAKADNARELGLDYEVEPFGIWHQGKTDDESDFYLFKDSGDVSCPDCIKLYTHPPVPQGHKPKAAVPVEHKQEPQPVLYVKDIGGNFHEYTKEKGHTENCAAFADDCSENHPSPSRLGVGEYDYTQPKTAVPTEHKQEPLCTAAMFDDAFLSKSGLDPKTPLYTSPYVATPRQPQKPWVGLSQRDTDWCIADAEDDPILLVINVERILREQNT